MSRSPSLMKIFECVLLWTVTVTLITASPGGSLLLPSYSHCTGLLDNVSTVLYTEFNVEFLINWPSTFGKAYHLCERLLQFTGIQYLMLSSPKCELINVTMPCMGDKTVMGITTISRSTDDMSCRRRLCSSCLCHAI